VAGRKRLLRGQGSNPLILELELSPVEESLLQRPQLDLGGGGGERPELLLRPQPHLIADVEGINDLARIDIEPAHRPLPLLETEDLVVPTGIGGSYDHENQGAGQHCEVVRTLHTLSFTLGTEKCYSRADRMGAQWPDWRMP